MKGTKFFSGIFDFAAAYCVGHCSLLGSSPFGTALLGAGSISGRNPWAMFAGLMCTFVERQEYLDRGKLLYPCIWLMVMLFLRARRLQLLHPRTFLLSVLGGAITGAVQVAAGIWLPGASSVWQGMAEGVLVFSFMFVFAFAYGQIAEHKGLFTEDTQTQLAYLILATSIFCGIPLRMFGVIEVLQTVGLLSIFYVSYRCGFSAGISWAAVVGAVYAVRVGEMKVLVAWVLLALVTNSLSQMLHLGRYPSVLIYAAGYGLIGYFGFPVLLSEEGSKAWLASVFILIFLPGCLFVPGHTGKTGEHTQGAEWGRLTLDRVRRFSSALKRIDYTFAGTQGQQIGFSQIGTMLDSLAGELDCREELRTDLEAALVTELGRHGIKVKSLTLLKKKNGSCQLYVDACVSRGRLVGAETVRQIAGRKLGIAFELDGESRQYVGRNYDLVILNQKPSFAVRTAARRLSCMEDVVSGDNFFVGNLSSGATLIMIADGMGNGAQAAADSEQLLASVEELVDSGFEQEMAVRLVNAYLSEKNKGEHFTTLDMFLFDRYTGVGQLVKYGAAPTYIRRGNWMECVKSTSLPVGILAEAGCESSMKKYYKDDLIVMVSDGVLDSILFENKDDYMNTLISGLGDGQPEEIAEAIVEDIRKVCGKRLKDDATLVVCRIMKNS